MHTQTMVTQIKLPMANAYLVQGRQAILVDAGAPGDADRIVQALQRAGVAAVDLALILLTHGHGDHVGAANELSARSGAPVAIHPADDAMARSGRNNLGMLNGLEARLIAPFVDKPFAPVAASLQVDDAFDLRTFGVEGRVLTTSGHTPGSISVLLDSGDAIVGDLLMGGRLGGALQPQQPRLHYFVDDFVQLGESMERVLERKPRRLLVGHGGPLDAEALRSWWVNSARNKIGLNTPGEK